MFICSRLGRFADELRWSFITPPLIAERLLSLHDLRVHVLAFVR